MDHKGMGGVGGRNNAREGGGKGILDIWASCLGLGKREEK